MNQIDPSQVSVTTSTINPIVGAVVAKFNIESIIFPNMKSIGADWNHALQASKSEWVTLAHQDDIYYPDYAAEVKRAIEAHPDACIIFTDYDEIKDERFISGSKLIKLKRVLLEIGFWRRNHISSKWAKKNCLRFGCAIPCPTVTIRTDLGFRFDESLKVNLDWDAWLRLAESEGSFVWIRKPLMAHRIHDGQESASAIRSGVRQHEDLMMLKRLWPSFLAHLIEKTYRLMR